MYISGENIVVKPYTPVDAYAVMPMEGGITSGGTGGDATVTQGVRFLWVYNPGTPDGPPSGFSGKGWFADMVGSPIEYSKMKLSDILQEFSTGARVDLNDVFQKWQGYVDKELANENDILKTFQMAVGYDCWTNLN